MKTSEMLTTLQDAAAPVELFELIRKLQVLRAWTTSVQQQLVEQQIDELNPQIDNQLEALGGFYKAIAESTQTALEQCVRISSNVKHLPGELGRRVEAVLALEASI